MSRRKNHRIAAAARAREGRARARLAQRNLPTSRPQSPIYIDSSDSEPLPPSDPKPPPLELDYHPVDRNEPEPPSEPSNESSFTAPIEAPLEPGSCTPPDDVIDDSDDDSVYELQGDELLSSLEKQAKTAYHALMCVRDHETWTKSERRLKGVRPGAGTSARTVHWHQKAAREKENKAFLIRESQQARAFRAFFSTTKQLETASDSLTLQDRVAAAVAAKQHESDIHFRREQLLGSRSTTGAGGGRSDAGERVKPRVEARLRDDIRKAVEEARRQCDAAFVQRGQSAFMTQANVSFTAPAHVWSVDIQQTIDDSRRVTDSAFLARSSRAFEPEFPSVAAAGTWAVAVELRAGEARNEPALDAEEPDVEADDEEEGDDSDFEVGYLSDLSEDAEDVLPDGSREDRDQWDDESTACHSPDEPLGCTPASSNRVNDPPPTQTPSTVKPTSTTSSPAGVGQKRPAPHEDSDAPCNGQQTGKRRQHDVPLHCARQLAAAAARTARQNALKDIKKVLASKRDLVVGGSNSLQVYRARAVQACLHIMEHEKSGMMEALVVAARANMFTAKWGAWLVRSWVREWIRSRTLPESHRGRHSKIVSLLSNPTVRAGINAYLRSQKWSQDPVRLKKFLHNELGLSDAQEYSKIIISEEMPQGLKHYVENSVLPRLNLKPGRHGLSLLTMRRLLLSEGFTYSEHRKAIYYDGHERPDVVADRQGRFIPAMQSIRDRLVQYEVGNVSHQLPPK
ncbi:hypothetical protein C8T65DRAFT_694053 [Cerioporus squamosus]|nr:hypothetical protein C8T65DRAFT_694053 [Cerioporus squamosus]